MGREGRQDEVKRKVKVEPFKNTQTQKKKQEGKTLKYKKIQYIETKLCAF